MIPLPTTPSTGDLQQGPVCRPHHGGQDGALRSGGGGCEEWCVQHHRSLPHQRWV